jgi:hypothetical protein
MHFSTLLFFSDLNLCVPRGWKTTIDTRAKQHESHTESLNVTSETCSLVTKLYLFKIFLVIMDHGCTLLSPQSSYSEPVQSTLHPHIHFLKFTGIETGPPDNKQVCSQWIATFINRPTVWSLFTTGRNYNISKNSCSLTSRDTIFHQIEPPYQTCSPFRYNQLPSGGTHEKICAAEDIKFLNNKEKSKFVPMIN